MTEEFSRKAAEEKKRLRRALAVRAAALPRSYLSEAGEKISRAIEDWPRYRHARSIFVYVSMAEEPDTRALIGHALGAGKRVYVPKCEGPVMRAVAIASLEELRPGAFGIPEPVSCPETAHALGVDLILVPCVSADRAGRRLGHGAGYYDRFLQRGHSPAVCLCFEKMLTSHLPMTAGDVWMDYLATEAGVVPCDSGTFPPQ